MNLKKLKSIHFTGLKGVGMTALALCAKDLQIKVTGSDTNEVFPTDPVLKARKIRSKVGFKASHIPKNCQLLIYTGAHGGATNPEVKAAKVRNIPVLSHAQALALFSKDKLTITAAGVGGKSTTSAMIAVILEKAGLKPSFAIGVGDIPAINTPGKFVKKSPHFVAEADEYVTDPETDPTPRFHYLNPFIAIITNIEHDHPDVYPSLVQMFKAFKTFVKKVPQSGTILVNLDSPNVKEFVSDLSQPVVSYGFSPQSDWQITKSHLADKKQFFTLKFNKVALPNFILNVPGKYNLLNAAAAIASCYHLGVSVEKIQAGIKAFTGTSRRFELVGKVKKIQLYDDYAHHPTEIKALLKAAKAWFPGKRLITIFQSHTYSRTKALLPQFAKSFQLADEVIITKIFSSAREIDNLGISGQSFAKEVKRFHPYTYFCSGKTQTIKHLVKNVKKDDIIFTIGAGDIFLWHKDILKALRNPKKQ